MSNSLVRFRADLAETRRRHANGFWALETKVNDLRHMSKLAVDNMHHSSAPEADIAAWTLFRLDEMIQDFREEYYRLANDADPRERGVGVKASRVKRAT